MEGSMNGQMEDRRIGGMEGWKDGGVEGWREGRMEGMAESGTQLDMEGMRKCWRKKRREMFGIGMKGGRQAGLKRGCVSQQYTVITTRAAAQIDELSPYHTNYCKVAAEDSVKIFQETGVPHLEYHTAPLKKVNKLVELFIYHARIQIIY